MRRAPAQNKVDKTGSPRVTLRLHQLKGRDEKRSNQQQKGADAAAASYETRLQFSINMDQGNKGGDDVYEFKSSKDGTPVAGSPTEADTSKSSVVVTKECDTREQSSTSPAARAATPGSPSSTKEEGGKEGEANKRTASEMDGADDADEENKRKRRKEDKADSKDSLRNLSGSGRTTGRNGGEKAGKNGSTSSKGNGNGKSSLTAGSSGTTAVALGGSDRKSPSNAGSAGNSPKAPPSKPSSAQGDSESEGDEGKKDSMSGSGPKVPPLKIVIPQQSSAEQEQGTRNGKNGNGRHQALPYVVTSSNDSEQGAVADKLEAGASCSGLSKDEKKDAAALQEERSQRVLRSSHRSSNHGAGGGGGAGGSSSSSSLPLDSMANSPSPSKSDDKPEINETPVELHPRKRKIKSNKESSIESSSDPPSSHTDIHPHDQPITNCYEMFLNIRKQIDRRRKGLFPVQPKPPQGFKDYLMNRCTYVLASNASSRQVQRQEPPPGLAAPMRELFLEQEKERYRLCLQHVIEKEKLVLSVEQEILRVHGRAARALANQSLPFSVCTILKDEEVYNVITPEQEEKDRNARSRYNGRLFLSWLQDVDDKWEKIKENMLLRHHNEADSLHAVQKMDWEWKLKEHSLCEFKAKPVIDDAQVPIVHVSDDFDLLPA